MFLGKVIGTVWSTVKWPQLGGLKLLLVRPYHLAELAPALAAGLSPPPDHEAVVCADLMDAGVGDDVIIAYGHAARVAAWEALLSPQGGAAVPDAPPIPIDAAVVAVVDGMQVEAAG
jgi:ethanolamine utilization protein EutN